MITAPQREQSDTHKVMGRLREHVWEIHQILRSPQWWKLKMCNRMLYLWVFASHSLKYCTCQQKTEAPKSCAWMTKTPQNAKPSPSSPSWSNAPATNKWPNLAPATKYQYSSKNGYRTQAQAHLCNRALQDQILCKTSVELLGCKGRQIIGTWMPPPSIRTS
jgi:hypothetical protein